MPISIVQGKTHKGDTKMEKFKTTEQKEKVAQFIIRLAMELRKNVKPGIYVNGKLFSF